MASVVGRKGAAAAAAATTDGQHPRTQRPAQSTLGPTAEGASPNTPPSHRDQGPDFGPGGTCAYTCACACTRAR
eukprot:3572-Alexandrium_andersonii.AAC.1